MLLLYILLFFCFFLPSPLSQMAIATCIFLLYSKQIRTDKELNELRKKDSTIKKELTQAPCVDTSAMPTEQEKSFLHSHSSDSPIEEKAINSIPQKEQVQPSLEKPKSANSFPSHSKQASPSKTPPASEQASPIPIDKTIQAIQTFFTSGNIIVKVALVVLFFGAAFLLKYASVHNLIPTWSKYTSLLSLASAMSFLGWRLREKRRSFADLLQGGGWGLMYMTLFASFRLHNYLSASSALITLAVLSICFLAVSFWQNSRYLASFAFLGAFLAPILCSTGSGNYLALFSFYLLLSLAGLFICYKKPWPEVPYVTFIFSLIIAFLWGRSAEWQNEIANLEVFLALFFFIHLLASFSHKLKKFPSQEIMFYQLPASLTAIQILLLRDIDKAMGWHFLSLTAIYLILSKSSSHLSRASSQIMTVAALLAIPAFFNNQVSSVLWSLSAAGILISPLAKRSLFQVFCSSLALMAAPIFHLISPNESQDFLFNSHSLNALILSISFLIASEAYRRLRTKGDEVYTLLSYATLMISGGLFYGEIFYQLDGENTSTVLLTLISASLLYHLILNGFARLTKNLRLREAFHAHNTLATLLSVIATIAMIFHEELSWIFFAILTFSWALFLYENFRNNRLHTGWARFSHLLFLITVDLHLSHGLVHLFKDYAQVNGLYKAGLWLTPSLVLLMIINWANCFPFKQKKFAYHSLGKNTLLTILLFFSFMTNLVQPSGHSEYLAIFNPFDLLLISLLIIFFKEGLKYKNLTYWLSYSIFAFITLNSGILRQLFYYGSLNNYQLETILKHSLAQMSFSFLWTIIGMILMFFSQRKSLPVLWKSGAIFLAMVVVKLFTVDLAGSDTLSRVFSFLGVGLLLLSIGYFFPCPNGTGVKEEEE